MVVDLAHCCIDGRWVRVHSLADNVPSVTAWANDECFEQAFAAQVMRYLDSRDVMLAVSVSGRSPNIVAALRAARSVGAGTVGLLGSDGGVAAGMCDLAVVVPSTDYGVVEVVHLAIAHALVDTVRGGSRHVAGVDPVGVGAPTGETAGVVDPTGATVGADRPRPPVARDAGNLIGRPGPSPDSP
jgi:hypothetical protein